MKIGVDIRALLQGKETGVEEYVEQLLVKLFDVDQKNEYILFYNAWRIHVMDLSWVEKYPNVSIKRFRVPNKLFNFSLWYFGYPEIDRLLGNVDIFFMPNLNFIALSQKTRLLLTVHDLSFEHYPQTFSWKRRLWHSFVNPRRLCKRADTIFAVSASTKADLVETYGIQTKKIVESLNGLSERFRKRDRNDLDLLAVKDRYHLPYKFILALGTIEPRKNIVSVVRAYNRLRTLGQKNFEQYKLVISGGRGWKMNETMQEILTSPFHKDIIITDFIATEDKISVYNLAELFVYPSHFEGFGFPPLEAMRCGTPVITSNTSSLPEIVGSAAILIDPDQPDELYRAMKEVLSDTMLREYLITRGMRRSMHFQWLRSAQTFLQALS